MKQGDRIDTCRCLCIEWVWGGQGEAWGIEGSTCVFAASLFLTFSVYLARRVSIPPFPVSSGFQASFLIYRTVNKTVLADDGDNEDSNEPGTLSSTAPRKRDVLLPLIRQLISFCMLL